MVKSAKTTFLLFKFKSSMVLDTTNPPQVFSVPPWYQSSFLRGVLIKTADADDDDDDDYSYSYYY